MARDRRRPPSHLIEIEALVAAAEAAHRSVAALERVLEEHSGATTYTALAEVTAARLALARAMLALAQGGRPGAHRPPAPPRTGAP